MTGFELWTSAIGSNGSANLATSTASTINVLELYQVIPFFYSFVGITIQNHVLGMSCHFWLLK